MADNHVRRKRQSIKLNPHFWVKSFMPTASSAHTLPLVAMTTSMAGNQNQLIERAPRPRIRLTYLYTQVTRIGKYGIRNQCWCRRQISSKPVERVIVGLGVNQTKKYLCQHYETCSRHLTFVDEMTMMTT